MQGPELRIGAVEQPMELEEGNLLVLVAEYKRLTIEEKNESAVACKKINVMNEQVRDVVKSEHQLHIVIPFALQQAIEPSDEILLDDGKILLRVEHTDADKTLAKVLRGGILRSHKSIKLIGKNVALPPLTAHDIENIRHAKAFGVTALMQPFVRGKEDLRYVRDCLKEHDAVHIKIFAKIENRIGFL